MVYYFVISLLLGREYMVDVWMEKVYPMSEKVYLGEL
jgi:hypothetical protein